MGCLQQHRRSAAPDDVGVNLMRISFGQDSVNELVELILGHDKHFFRPGHLRHDAERRRVFGERPDGHDFKRCPHEASLTGGPPKCPDGRLGPVDADEYAS